MVELLRQSTLKTPTGESEAVQHRSPGGGSPGGVGARLSPVRAALVRERSVRGHVVSRPRGGGPESLGVGVGLFD